MNVHSLGRGVAPRGGGTRFRRVGPAVVAVLLYLALSLAWVGRSIHPEEIDTLRDHRLLHTPSAQVSDEACERLSCVRLGDLVLPLTEDSPYVGPIEVYLQQPFFALLGETPLALRLPPILLGVAVLLALHALACRWAGPRVAAWAALLTASHPAFVHFGRQGHAAEEIFAVAFLWIALYAFARAGEARTCSLTGTRPPDRSGAAAWALLGALSLGLGASQKITFLWYAFGLVVAAPLQFRALPGLGRPSRREGAALAAGLLTGSAPLLAYNVRSGCGTLMRIWEGIALPMPKGGVSNWHYLENLATRTQQFWETTLLGGFWFWPPLHFACRPDRVPPCDLSTEPSLPLWGLGLTFLAGLVVVPVVARRGWEGFRAVPWLWTLYGIVFLCTPFTISGRLPNHLTVMHPFVGLVVAFGIEALVRAGGAATVRFGAALGVLLVVWNVYLTVEVHRVAPVGAGLQDETFDAHPSGGSGSVDAPQPMEARVPP